MLKEMSRQNRELLYLPVIELKPFFDVYKRLLRKEVQEWKIKDSVLL